MTQQEKHRPDQGRAMGLAPIGEEFADVVVELGQNLI